jgi:AmpD protein
MERLMRIDVNGCVDGFQCIISPNCDDRPSGTLVEMLVIHNISLPPDEFGGDGVIELFTNRLNPSEHPYYQTVHSLKVSSHFFIRRGGEIIQFVPCDKRAWHAGLSSWGGRNQCNDFSIGVELEGSDRTAFTDDQYRALIRLSLLLQESYPIKDIVGHSDIAAGRKTDPGPHFDWDRYRSALVAEKHSQSIS